MNAKDSEVRRKVTALKSEVDRLKGKVDALIEAAREHGGKIERLEVKQRKLDGFRAHMS